MQVSEQPFVREAWRDGSRTLDSWTAGQTLVGSVSPRITAAAIAECDAAAAGSRRLQTVRRGI